MLYKHNHRCIKDSNLHLSVLVLLMSIYIKYTCNRTHIITKNKTYNKHCNYYIKLHYIYWNDHSSIAHVLYIHLPIILTIFTIFTFMPSYLYVTV